MGATLRPLVRAIGAPLLAIVIAMGLGFLLVVAVSDDPILAYRDLLFANFDSSANFSLFVNRTMPLLLVGLGVVFSFRAGVFNVGGEGQLYLGAIAATATTLWAPALPGPLLAAAAILAGVAAGAALSVKSLGTVTPVSRRIPTPWKTGPSLSTWGHRRDPRPERSAFALREAEGVGGACAPTWVSSEADLSFVF